VGVREGEERRRADLAKVSAVWCVFSWIRWVY
jgi:hypothetical protein